MAWASQTEAFDSWLRDVAGIPPARFDFLIRDEWDNGEFMTGATVDLLENGVVVATETFRASSEDAPCGGYSAYGNGLSNHAGTQARSFAFAWLDSMTTPLEERLAPFGPAWFEEMEMEMASC